MSLDGEDVIDFTEQFLVMHATVVPSSSSIDPSITVYERLHLNLA